MSCKNMLAFALMVAIGMIVVGRRAAAAEPGKNAGPAQPEMKLPPGWTEADIKACMLAGTPGKMQEFLTQSVGVWEGKNTMWPFPGSEAIKSQSTATITSLMGGRYTKCETAGDMPGMGPFSGLGIYGFDNVSGKFVATWIDNFGTGIMNGTGELSPDGKTLTWSLTYTCPITKKPTIMREIDTITGPNTKTLEMFGTDPKSGKEFKMVTIEMTRKP